MFPLRLTNGVIIDIGSVQPPSKNIDDKAREPFIEPRKRLNGAPEPYPEPFRRPNGAQQQFPTSFDHAPELSGDSPRVVHIRPIGPVRSPPHQTPTKDYVPSRRRPMNPQIPYDDSGYPGATERPSFLEDSPQTYQEFKFRCEVGNIVC